MSEVDEERFKPCIRLIAKSANLAKLANNL